MSDQTLNALLETTYTRENLHRKTMLLKEFFSEHFFGKHLDIPIKESLNNFLNKNNVGDFLKNSIISLSDDFFSCFTADNIANIINELEEEVKSRPSLVLYVPTILPPTEVENLGKWVRSNIKEGMFIDLRVDSLVIGGCAFVWNGVYHDYSLKYYFDKNRTEVKNLVRSFDNGQ